MPKPSATIKLFALNEATDARFEDQAYTESVGGRLRHEREAQRISEKAAAHKLHLMVTDLRAIESDSYNPTAHDDLLRNYLRDYANFLALNPDSILAIYDRQAGTSFHRGTYRIDDIPRAQATGAGSLVTGSLVVATVVLGFLVIMQFTDTSTVNALLAGRDNRAGAEAQRSALPQTTDTDTAADDDVDLTLVDVQDEAAVTPVASGLASAGFATALLTTSGQPIDQAEEGDLPTPAAAEPQPALNLETAVGSRKYAQTLNAPEKPEKALITNKVTTNHQRNAGNSMIEVPAAYRREDGVSPAAPAAAIDELAFRFARDCWVEVYDANNKRLIAKTNKAGDKLHLSGKSPFNVLVGHSREVVLQFNGHPVEIEQIERSFSTLFKVERASADAALPDAAPKVTTIRRKWPDYPAKSTAVNVRAEG